MYFTTKSLIAASGLVMVAQGHMIMRTPTPYTSPQANSSPLDPSGSDFPCKAGAGAQYAGTATPMEKGSKQTLSFTGSATHGGGSCQVSITYDNPPTKQSKWKVIHSIQGGCPARNTAGNLGNDPTMEAPDKYEFAIPQDIPSGNATLAWTWFNKVGNREMYMNCSPIDIVGSEGSEAALAGLPDMMVANIAGTDCTTKEGVDIKFPNPGSSVETNSGAALGSPTGNCGGRTAPAIRGRRPMDVIKNAGNYVSDKVQSTTHSASKEANKEVAKGKNSGAQSIKKSGKT